MKRFLLAMGGLGTLVIVAGTVITSNIKPQMPTAPIGDIQIQGLLNFTNKNRATPLVLDERLNRSAQAKCEDMVTKNYWAHISPGGVKPEDFISKQIGVIPGREIGENLIENPHTSKSAVDWWMGSPEHKVNIQDLRFTRVGFGVCTSKSYIGSGGLPATIVVQHFAG